MEREVQQAEKMGELTASVKNTNVILERMENKLDGAIEKVSSHDNTIALLARLSSENSGAIKALQVIVVGQNGKDGLVRDINELTKYKEEQCKLQEENRTGIKRIFFSIGEKVAWVIVGGFILSDVALEAIKHFFTTK